ncbi:MAG: glycosyltransferase [Lachnospiraceae bacterium]|nr:glycosyltransferase [Lachnospiraceae bacterium]
MTYQDNMLVKACCDSNHSVVYISDIFHYYDGELVPCEEGEYKIADNFRLIRVKYDTIISNRVASKIRKVSKLKKILEEIKPDVILYHEFCGYELLTVAEYVKENPNVIFYGDAHADFHNTAKTSIAKLFYRYIHGYFVKKALPYVRKVLCISMESMDYLKEMYKITEDKIEWYPLGGMVFNDEFYNFKRKKIREEIGLSDEEILFVHSGKMNKEKKTEELLRAFTEIKDNRFRLILIGSLTEEVKEAIMPYVETDSRIEFLGWKTGDELQEYLCAADMYMQPGTQSATMQNAICCRCAVMLYPYRSHVPYVVGNGYFVENMMDIKNVLLNISGNPEILKEMSYISKKMGSEILDYSKLAERLCI